MDKSWIGAPRVSDAYKLGCEAFVNFASAAEVCGTIFCPCLICGNDKRKSPIEVLRHILFSGFCPGYTTWTLHGEHISSSQYDTPYINRLVTHKINGQPDFLDDTSNMRDMINDALGMNLGEGSNGNIDRSTRDCVVENTIDDTPQDSHHEHVSGSAGSKYQRILEEYDKELYSGCKYSQLSFTLHLYHIKCMGGLSNKCFTMLLEFLKEAFPFVTSLPSSAYEAKKLCNDLGLGYQKIHACPNDCILYWGDNVDNESCHVCHASRWKEDDKEKEEDASTCDLDESKTIYRKKKPAKVLRYFPLIPRLKRIYASQKTAKSMRWHEIERTKDGILRHPADGLAWKDFDERHQEFAKDHRSVRLGLASDGFNPFRTMSSTYSTWPVLLVPYNLPPWLCMKQHSLILSMIIPGEKSPGNNIDIFLQPLIHELKELWNGVDAFDAFAAENFKLKAALMWTINDFPAYAMLSGWTTKGRVACPVCTSSTCSTWLKHGRKFSYMGHRRWLSESHPFRVQKQLFDGTEEYRMPPDPLSGTDVLKQLDGTTFIYGKTSKPPRKRTRDMVDSGGRDTILTNEADFDGSIFEDDDEFVNEDSHEEEQLWKKRSIFFDLPYWEHNLLRHNLDVMHIEKNVCDSLLGTLLNLDGKSKDNEKARLDLMEMAIRYDLHLIIQPNKKPFMPPACYTLSSNEKNSFLQVLKELKVPDGYASNISRGVNLKDRKISNLKSHDAHILMQDILPIACKASMHSREQAKVVKVVSDLCLFFKGLCSKVLDPSELDKLESQVAMTLSEMETLFPPSFFTIMVHLVIHLVAEARLGGPVTYRWMYPIERFLARLKSYVRNRAQPEGSIAEGYIADECLTFCSRYFEGIETRFNKCPRNDDVILDQDIFLFQSGGRIIGKVESIQLDDLSLSQAHRYVLLQSEKISPYLNHFLKERQKNHHGRVTQTMESKWIVEEFPWWLQQQVPIMQKFGCDVETIALARGPNSYAKRFKAFIINGFRFHIRDREIHRKTQNSGIVVEVEESNSERENVVDTSHDKKVQKYFGFITDMYELDYYGKGKVVLFRCNWVNVNSPRGFKKDKYGLPLVNFSRLIHTGQQLKDDPFVLSSNVKQVFYVQDGSHSDWMHVIQTKPRDLYDMGANLDEEDTDSYTECMPSEVFRDNDITEPLSWRRTDIIEENDAS